VPLPVYSQRFIDATLPDGGTAFFDVVAGFVAIVHEIQISIGEENGGDMAFALALGLDASLASWLLPPAWAGTIRRPRRTVVLPGSTLTASFADSLASQTCHVEVSGYLLTTP